MRFRELKIAEYGAQAPTGTTGTTPPGKVGQQMGKGPNAPKTNPTLQKKVQQANAQVTNKVLKPGQKLSIGCLLYTSPSPRDLSTSRMPSSA